MRTGFAWALAVVAVSLLAISGRSFWIDEAATAVQAMQPNLASWWHLLVREKTAHLQMPLYMFYAWAYEKLFGVSEWDLRLANLPWFVAGATAFILAFPREGGSRACVVLLCPFAWYYLDEARPYGMQIGISLLLVASLEQLGRESSVSDSHEAIYLGLFLFGILALSASTIIAMIWAGGALLAMMALLPWTRLVNLVRRYWYLWLGTAALLMAFAGYYVWTLSLGARATMVGTTTATTVLFVGYELLGFSGLGPGRLALRNGGPAELRPYLVWLALYAVPTGILIGAALLQLFRRGNRRYLAVAGCCCLPAVFLMVYGWAVHFRVLGRHCTPFIAVLLFLLSMGGSVLWAQRSAWARAVVVLFCTLSLLSCLSLRFLARHEKDNYRAAAALAKAALLKGQPVWWNAAPEGALYYNLPINTRPGSANEAALVWNPTRETLLGLPPPQVIIASKPDVYDGQQAVAQYIREHGFQPERSLAAFVIWRKAGK